VILILGAKLYHLIKRTKLPQVNDTKSIAYLVPCYNESRAELSKTIDSLINQDNMQLHKRMLFIVCDGRVKGARTEKSTDLILKEDILTNCISIKLQRAYKCWNDTFMNIELLYGQYNGFPVMCIIKDVNMGKRDSLVLVRDLLYTFSHKRVSTRTADAFFALFKNECYSNGILKFDYVIGTDADTVFDKDCSSNLLNEIDWDPNTHGVVGFVDVSPECSKWSFWTIYQYTEYITAQYLRRLQQSLVTKKVSCLSGCVQILRVSKETCGSAILKAFNYLPSKTENVIRHVRSFASEDRNHVCLFLHMYPYVRTRQCLQAIAYTTVPMDFKVFRSQRRRWSLGATCNDLLLTYKSGINLYERIGAVFNVITFSLNVFIFVSTVIFLKSLFTAPSMMMLYLSTVLIVPWLYNFSLIFWYPFKNVTERIRFFIGLLMYLMICPVMNLIITVYSIFNVDCFKWGKTRASALDV
jgi:chitin synthase